MMLNEFDCFPAVFGKENGAVLISKDLFKQQSAHFVIFGYENAESRTLIGQAFGIRRKVY